LRQKGIEHANRESGQANKSLQLDAGVFRICRVFDKCIFLKMVTPPGLTWKQFWQSMEQMSDKLEELGINSNK
jgi:hypothetical protein